MATTVSNLAINFGANTSGLKTGVAEVQGSLGKLGGATASTGSSLAGLTALINPYTAAMAGAAAAAYGLANAVSASNERLDVLAKSADKAGIATETYQGFAHAASLAGSSGEQLGDALSKLQRNLVDARDGTGAAADALKLLGLDAQAVANMSTEDAFKAIADGIAGIEDPAARTSAAMDLFGRAGADLIPLLAGGSEALQQGVDLIEEYGLGISRVDAGKVEAANDAWTDLFRVLEGVADKLAVALAPASQKVAESLTQLAGEVARFLDESGPGIEAFANGLAEVLYVAVQIVSEFIKMATEAARWSTEIGRAVGLINDDKFANFRKPIEQAAEAAEDTAAAIVGIDKELDKLMKRGESLAKSLRLPDEIYDDTIAELKQLAAAGAITEETFGRAFREAAEELNKSTIKAQQAFQPLNVGAVTRNSTAGFSAIFDAQNAQKKLESIVQKQLDEDRRHTRQNEEMIAAFRSTQQVNVVTSI